MPTLPTLNDYYAKFGLPSTATSADVRAAYRTLVKRHHPDLYATPAAKHTATEKLQELNEAYAAISRHQRHHSHTVPHENASACTVPNRFFEDVTVVRRSSHRKLKRAISAAMSSACAAAVLYLGIRHLRYAVELDLVDSLTYTVVISFVLAIILATLLAPDPQQ